MKKENLIGKLIENPKSLIAVAIGIVIIALLIYFIIKRSSSKIKGAINSVSDSAKIQEHINETGEQPSYNDFEYKSMADQIERAMRGCGTDEDAIFDVMKKMRNNTDVMKLKQAFGTRGDEDLSQWLGGDLSSSEMKKVNTILSGNGITLTF